MKRFIWLTIFLALSCLVFASCDEDSNVKRSKFELEVPIKTVQTSSFNASIIEIEGRKFIVFTGKYDRSISAVEVTGEAKKEQ